MKLGWRFRIKLGFGVLGGIWVMEHGLWAGLWSMVMGLVYGACLWARLRSMDTSVPMS